MIDSEPFPILHPTRKYGPRQAPIQGCDTGFTKVCPSANVRELLIKKYRALGWVYFLKFKDVGGFGLQAYITHN